MEAPAALLQAICAAPESDAPRLVYADWLGEREDPLGELIVLQVEQAKLRPRTPEFQKLQQRIEVLWAAGRQAWAPKVVGVDPAALCNWGFERGFATAVQTVAQAFVGAMEAFFAAAPLLEDVELECVRGPPAQMEWLEELVAQPAFARVKTLRLRWLNDTGAVVLCGLDGVRGLEGLELSRTQMGQGTYQLLGSADSTLLGLTRLELTMANSRGVALAHLFRHPWLKLQTLRVAHRAIGERGMRAITEPGRLPGLRQLDLSWSPTGGVRSMVQLARCPTLSRLEVLDLSHCSVSDEMGEVLATAEGFTLKELRLAHTGIGARGIQALLESRVARQLELLDLTGCALEGPTRKLLRDRLGDRALV